jgi:Protein of unknown function DUF262
MKNFDSRTYSINDFLEWDNNHQLELSPRFQRRSVWTDQARSYLMDTIVRGKPIPKFFIRQRINALTKASIREVVDGQQRLRTILSYLKDGFQISKRHHPQYGGFYFSQLFSVDEQIQANILNYELSVDLLINMPDSEVLDVFGRLNSYAVVLNTQEKINADHFGPFKILADELAHANLDFWIANRILSDSQVTRMADVTLTADLLIAMIEGIKSKKQLKGFYDKYEKEFEHDVKELAFRFTKTIGDIERALGESLRTSEFRRVPLFYSLFTALFHLRWGLPGIERPTFGQEEWNYSRLQAALGSVEQVLLTEDRKILSESEAKFLTDTRLATTDAAVRVRRTTFILDQIG